MGSGVTASQIEARFLVNPETGAILRNSNGSRYLTRVMGHIKPVTSNAGGYRLVSLPIGGKKYKKIPGHHIIWMWAHGEWPKAQIDHINGIRSDNRISNLRLATVTQNKFNRVIQTNNKSGYKWVYKCCQTNTWRAEVTYTKDGVKKKLRSSGHKTPDAAYEIASNFAKSAHGKFYNSGKPGSYSYRV